MTEPNIISFAYTLQLPDDCTVLDARILPFPGSSESGQTEAVREEVMRSEEAQALVASAFELLKQGRPVAFGCMYGYQRSVALAEATAAAAREAGLTIEVDHRELR